MPLKFKRKFIAAIDAHLSDRYPMFKGLSKGWPSGKLHPALCAPAGGAGARLRAGDQGYLGYMSLGYSAREVDLLVWLEVLRDKQCEDRPCELGVLEASRKPKGGCPVEIHIPEMLNLLGTGKFKEALRADRGAATRCPTSPAASARRSCNARASARMTGRPIEIGQLEWFLPEREKLLQPGTRRRRALEELRHPVDNAPRSRRSRWSAPAPPASSTPICCRRGLSGHRVRGLP